MALPKRRLSPGSSREMRPDLVGDGKNDQPIDREACEREGADYRGCTHCLSRRPAEMGLSFSNNGRGEHGYPPCVSDRDYRSHEEKLVGATYEIESETGATA